MIPVSITEEISRACPALHLLVLEGTVRNGASPEALWATVEAEAEHIRNSCQLETLNQWEPIRATRQAYKRLGKDPNRYRPSSEALRRRILRALPLYRIDALVDLINLLSIRCGHSIGGFDADKIVGGLQLGVGREGEPYHGIGRGLLNIAGMPVYRDALGGIGTPTSDEERTKISSTTTHLLMIVNGYAGKEGLAETGAYACQLLTEYVSATNLSLRLIGCDSEEQLMLQTR